MKKILLTLISGVTLLLTSCYTESIEEYNYTSSSPINTIPTVSIHTLLNSYELWYIDINKTKGYGETPFLQIAFTLSFNNGTLYANNNLVGIGKQGNGYGTPIGEYSARKMILNINHDIDGFETFDVFQINHNTIELYNPNNETSYFLKGYQRYNFDYDYIFYDNIHYFLQEYSAWEKSYTSIEGVPNEFDYENYLKFVSSGNGIDFKSSKDSQGKKPEFLLWDYSGIYSVKSMTNTIYLKKLILDYDYFTNDYFELSIIDDKTIELFHPESGTLYEFVGRGYIQYMRQNKKTIIKNRIQYTRKTKNNRKKRINKI